MFDITLTDALLRENGMHPDCVDLSAETEKFLTEMRDGLVRENGSSLLMLPTYINAEGEVPLGRKIIVMDAGGTNFRTAVVEFKEKGKTEITSFKAYPMPGTKGKLSKDEFFDEIAEKLFPLIGESDSIGFCFSYVFESLPDRDARLTAFCKEVEVEGAEGAKIGFEVERALKRRGATGSRSYTIINDSVAALLGGKAVGKEGFESFAGLILGTGLNACYIERTGEIKKIGKTEYAMRSMIVNTECGIYRGFSQGTVDREFDAGTQKPGDHMFEKMISGAYFGSVVVGTLRLLCKNSLLSGEFETALGMRSELPLKDVDAFMRGSEDNLVWELTATSEQDRAAVRHVIQTLYDRSARLVVAALTAIAERSGATAERPLCVCAEGTTFHKSDVLRERILRYVREFTLEKRRISIEFVKAEDATLVGTAVAGLLN